MLARSGPARTLEPASGAGRDQRLRRTAPAPMGIGARDSVPRIHAPRQAVRLRRRVCGHGRGTRLPAHHPSRSIGPRVPACSAGRGVLTDVEWSGAWRGSPRSPVSRDLSAEAVHTAAMAVERVDGKSRVPIRRIRYSGCAGRDHGPVRDPCALGPGRGLLLPTHGCRQLVESRETSAGPEELLPALARPSMAGD